jgi:acyl transferase domain-containing protein/dienelactone hydrolase/acyl carrier protein
VPGRAALGPVAFVYTGMGPQWWGMGRELLLQEPIFAKVVAACDEILAQFGMSMARELLRDEAESRLTSTLYAQVANFVVQAGLTALWREWGIEPAVIIGHSVGEVAAAYAAGVYSLEDALTVSFHRASLQAGLAGRGAMAAVGLPAEDLRAHLVPGAEIAAVNAPHATTLSGDSDAVAAVAQRLRTSGAPVQELRVEVAYHSHQMDEIREPLLAALRGIRPRQARIPLASTVTGELVSGTELDAGYWWRNVRQPVLFAAALGRVLRFSPGMVLEIGPHPVLAQSIDEALAERGSGQVHLASLNRRRPQRQQLLETLGALYAAGAEPDWAHVHPGPREHVELPRYPWQRERYWTESASSREARLRPGTLRFAGRPVPATAPTADVELSAAEFPYLSDHRIGQTVVFPGSGYLEAALAMFPGDTPCFLEDVLFVRPLALVPHAITTLRTQYDPDQRSVTLHSRGQGDEAWTLHARMRRPQLSRPRLPGARTRTLAELTESLPEVGHDEVYAQLDDTNLNYGPAFRAVSRIWVDEDAGEVFADLCAETGADAVVDPGHRLHPALLDAALQAMIVGAAQMSHDSGATYVPASIAEFRFFRTPGRQLWLHGHRSRRVDAGAGQLAYDLTLVTDHGEVVAEVTGLRVQRLAGDKDADVREAAPGRLYYESTWQPEAIDHTAGAEGTWILISSSPVWAGLEWEELERELTRRGGTVLRISQAEETWPDRVAAHVTSTRTTDGPTCRGVIWACQPAAPGAPACAPAAVLLPLVQVLPAAGVPLFLLTHGAQSVSAENATTDPSAAAVWGFAKVVSAERPELRCRLIDVDLDANSDKGNSGTGPIGTAPVGALADELTHDAVEEVALRAQARYIRRLERPGERSPVRHAVTRADSTTVRLGRDARGIDGLSFAAVPGRPPGPGEVEIEVSHVGLNFKDLLKVTGLLSPAAMKGSHSGETLGLECSGTIVAVGAEVADLRPGDEVFVHSRDLFRSRVTVDAVRVVRKPAALSLAQAASLFPSVTAHQALVRLAGVRAGERVLIHCAAGGVGLAATRIANWLGAEVYGTAGSPERREFLRGEGVLEVADSRSTTFADDIRRWTDGRGVDVVVNALAGEMLRKSLDLLAPFGRFVELGEADIAADQFLSLAPFQRALSFHAFDYDQMMALEPGYVRRCMREVADLYDGGALVPPLVTEVPAGETDAAFRAMSHSDHIGKIVVRMGREPVSVPASSLPGSPVRADATYVITGGLGGLGRTVARMLADRGARHLVLVGKTGVATAEAERAVRDLAEAGVNVHVLRADVGDRGLVRDVFARIRTELPPVRGVFHAAADFDDVVLSATDPARLIAATRPKADGAWNLHLETESDDLDFFVLFSSVAAQIGAAAAAAYATANEYLNALARYRHARDLPATSVGWGMIAEVGVAASRDVVGNALRRNGHTGISPARLSAELETLLRTRPVEVCVADIDWGHWARVNPQLGSLPRYQALVPAGEPDGSSLAPASRRLRDADPAERAALLPALIVPLLEQVTGMSREQLDGQQAVDIDSLTAVELRVSLQNALGVPVPAVKLQRNLTVAGLSRLLAEELDRTPDDAASSVGGIVACEFASSDGLVIFGHLSVPAGPGPHPAVVVCTSGAGGALDDQGRYAHVSEHPPLHRAGFAVFTVDHRGAPGHGADFRECAEMGGRDIDDVLSAARYLADLPQIDPARLSILGTSRGAYTGLLALARDPARWHRAVLVMGLSDPALLAAAERSRPGALLPLDPGRGVDEVQAYFAGPERQPLSQLDAMPAAARPWGRGRGRATRAVRAPGRAGSAARAARAAAHRARHGTRQRARRRGMGRIVARDHRLPQQGPR